MKKQKPTFEQFLAAFLQTVQEHAPAADASFLWLAVGDTDTRSAVLSNFKKQVEAAYGTELVVDPDLVSTDRTVESVAIQLYHVFSTVFLMETINAKIRARRH